MIQSITFDICLYFRLRDYYRVEICWTVLTYMDLYFGFIHSIKQKLMHVACSLFLFLLQY